MSSNEKRNEPAESKKEATSVLEKIRRRTGLLVGIVGLALVIFILESLLSSGQSIFGGNEMANIGKINGKNIDRNEFLTKVEMQLNQVRQRNQNKDVDDKTRNQVLDYVWNQYINEKVIKPEYAKVGLHIGDDELYDKVVANPVPSIGQRLVDQKTGRIYDQLANPMGELDPGKWKQFVQTAQGDQEAFVKELEETVKNTRQLEKYSALIRKGLYTTSAEAKEGYKAVNTQLSFSYVMKTFDSVSDSTVKLTDADIQKYYSEHSYEFVNPQTSRKIEYVVFNVSPSPEDINAIEKDATRAAEAFKGKTPSEDSTFIQQESENGQITIQNFTRKTMIVRDSSILSAAPGTVFGPFNEGAYLKIYKLEEVNKVADSARIRHILIGTIDPQTSQPKKSRVQARKEADSLLTLIKDKKVTFDTLVKTVSEDGGSKTNGGDYGWYNEDSRFVDPFKYAGLMGTPGTISIVETMFGYHIIEVLDVSKTSHTSYKVAQIFKLIAPSDETNDKVFAKANEFGGKNNTAELFDKAVDEQKLTKRVADNIKEGERELPGITQSKDIVKWIYEPKTKKGDVSVFSFPGEKHIVVKLSSIKNKGILPLEDVKDDVTFKARLAKKGEMMAAEFTSKAGGSANINDIASKLGLEVKKLDSIPATSHNVQGIHDDILMGTLIGSKAGQISKPTIGSAGVFVVNLNSKKEGKPLENVKSQQRVIEMEVAGRSDYEALNALKELANIEDHRSRLD